VGLLSDFPSLPFSNRRGGGGSEPLSGSHPYRRPMHERHGSATIGNRYIDQGFCLGSQGSIKCERMFPIKGHLGGVASLPVGSRMEPTMVCDAILQQDSDMLIPDTGVNKHDRCLQDDNSMEEGTPVEGPVRGLVWPMSGPRLHFTVSTTRLSHS
jgi:hypothetical protein